MEVILFADDLGVWFDPPYTRLVLIGLCKEIASLTCDDGFRLTLLIKLRDDFGAMRWK